METERATKKRKVCVIGQFPPPVHGLSKALDTMWRGLEENFDLEKIDIKDNKKILFHLIKLFKSRADVFYFTISQSKGGNRRDLWLLWLIAKKKKKCVVHLHGGYYRTLVDGELSEKQRKKNFAAMEKVDGAIVLSDSLKGIFAGMVPEEKIFTVSNCVDDEFVLSPGEWEKKREDFSKKNVLHILYLSNFNPEKGYKEALALAKVAKESGEGRFHFDFAGKFFDEKERAYFDSFVRENALEGVLTYHGAVAGEEKKRLLKEGDIFLLLTRYPKEGQPVSVIEAMANGMAVVSCDHAAIPDMVKDGENGILCRRGEEKDAVALYERIKDLSCDLPAVGERNYAAARERYSEKAYLAALREILEKI